MRNSIFEGILANHCAPVLMGTKLSNLISVTKSGIASTDELIASYNASYESYGISFMKLCECEARALILVYNVERLKRYLCKERVASVLRTYGYEDTSLDYCLDMLREKLMDFEFPHEIGIFLGFPLDDVVGFIENQGQNYVYCGYWKVYKNFEASKRTFDLYDKLRAFVKKRLMEGEALEAIVRDVHQNTAGLHHLLNAA